MDEKMSRKPFVREVPKVSWFFDHPRYVRYMTRELTCLFIGAYTILLVVGLARLAQGRETYEAFLTALQAPGSIVFHGLALAFAVYHSATWFNLTPKALPVQIGEDFLPGWVIAGLHYAAWIVLSLVALILAGAV
jgi:fumarate reductase subunit C